MSKLQSALEKSWLKPNTLTALLFPLSLAYSVANRVRRKLYSTGLLTSYKAPVPVIVVGNLTVGGTGKTPLVIHLVEELKNAGYRPAVISRGYLSVAPGYPYLVTAESAVAESGDEPAIIARRTNVPVMIGANRQQSIERLMAGFEIDVIVCDDGLQHLALERDLQICVTSPALEMQNTRLLPAGPYREPLNQINKSDYVVSSESSSDSSSHVMTVQAGKPEPMQQQDVASFDASSGVHLVCGIGSPERFFKTCESLGYSGPKHAFADHHVYQSSDIVFDDQLPVLMTEKDAVKCEDFASTKHWVLPVSVKLEPKLANDVIKRLNDLKQK